MEALSSSLSGMHLGGVGVATTASTKSTSVVKHGHATRRRGLVDLPNEILYQILGLLFPPWCATMSLTCELKPIANTHALRTCRYFYEEGTAMIQKRFTGEFIRYDRRGCIVDRCLSPQKWYAWIMNNTTTLHLYDADLRGWYIPEYWMYYPKLEWFRVSVLDEQTYRDVAAEMPDFHQRRWRCNERTMRLENGDYNHHQFLFSEVFVSVYKGLRIGKREVWPAVEYQYYDCRCHPGRKTVFTIQHGQPREEVEVIIDEAFSIQLFHEEQERKRLLHEAIVDCVSVSNRSASINSLRKVSVSLLREEKEEEI